MTNRELITAALRMLTVLDADETTASPEDARLGLDELNDLMSDLYTEDGIDLGYVRQNNVANQFPCSDDEAASIKPLLAMRLYSHFPSTRLPDTVPTRANSARNRLVRDAVLESMEESSLSNLPRGEGAGGHGDIINGD